jgi:hypothetical protein
MSGYCPAGKCECDLWHPNPDIPELGLFGCREVGDKLIGYQIMRLGYCPWPSRQVRMDIETKRDKAVGKMIDRTYEYGLAEGIRRCREAVEKLVDSHPDINVNAENGWVKLSVILAAIDAMKGE